MTHVCCPGCGLRFTGAAAAHLVACPQCGAPPQPVPSAEHMLGYRLADATPEHGDHTAIAVAVARPVPLGTSHD